MDPTPSMPPTNAAPAGLSLPSQTLLKSVLRALHFVIPSLSLLGVAYLSPLEEKMLLWL